MPPAAIVAAGALTAGSAIYGARAAKSAAGKEARAAQTGAQLQQQQFEQTREDLTPYRQIGTQALGALSELYGFTPYAEPGATPAAQPTAAPAQPTNALARLRTSPEYQFALEEGTRAQESGAAARGGLFSGTQLKESQRFGQGLASQQLGNYFARLNQLAGIGQASAVRTGQFGQAAASNVSNLLQAQGEARAGGQLGAANAFGQGVQGISNLYFMNRLLPQQPADTGGGNIPRSF